MSLATRCTACGTVFRVVQDQLKISEGWVRCGRCKEVFNALEGLFDLDREAPPPWQPPPPTPVPGSAVDVSLPVDDAQADAAPAAAAMTPVDASSGAADASQRTALEATPPTSDVAVEPPAAAPEPIVERPEPQHTVDDAVSRFVQNDHNVKVKPDGVHLSPLFRMHEDDIKAALPEGRTHLLQFVWAFMPEACLEKPGCDTRGDLDKACGPALDGCPVKYEPFDWRLAARP